MCGIFGFSLKHPLSAEDLQLGRRSVESIRHRGPDGSGEWVDHDKGFFLGHRRLAVIDLSDASQQPMTKGASTICYNGEIYNYRELKKQHGIDCQSSGDTEVLLAMWNQFGLKALTELDGMFAFALFDGDDLHLACDPFGEKPLYYVQTTAGVFFCSEAQPLIHELGLQPTDNQQDTYAFLALGFMPPPATGFEGLKILPPGGYCRVKAGEVVEEKTYWQFPETRVESGRVAPIRDTLLDEVADALITSLRRRLIADVPVGLFLSGGVDSGLIAALVANELNEKISTYTVAFPDGSDETVAAKRIADACALPHHIIDSQATDDWKQGAAYLNEVYGVANDNFTVASIHQMSHLVKPEITVALSGLGGDEMFWGYNKYDFLYRRRSQYRYLGGVLAGLSVLDPLLQTSAKWRSARRYLSGSAGEQFLSLKNSGLYPQLKSLPGFASFARSLLAGDTDVYQQVRDFDATSTLPASYIASVDRGSMRASLEVRTPFLSVELTRVLAKYDQRIFLHHGLKKVLRLLLERYVSPEVLEVKKQGFVFPINRVLAQYADHQVPQVRHVSSEFCQTVWRQRTQEGYNRLALRLAILEQQQQKRVDV